MSSTQALLRTQATSLMGAGYLATDHSVFKPTSPALAKQHIREEITHVSRSQDFQPGNTCRFEVTRDVDIITKVFLRFTASGIPVANWNGGATFTRWCDLLGLSCWTLIDVLSGTQRLQSVQPLENFIACMKFKENKTRRNVLLEWGQGTPAQRTASSLADKEITVPFFTLLGLNIHGDPGQGLYVRGLNDLLTIRVTLAPVNTLIETDGAMPTIPATGWFQNGVLVATGYHLEKSERAEIASLYKAKPFSLTFDDQQYATEQVWGPAVALPSTQTFALSNITQPVTALAFVFRWSADLNRVAAGAGGSRGRNLWNIAGWWNPGGGPTNEIVDTIAIRTGNNDIVATVPAHRLVNYQHEEDFQGDIVAALPAVSFSFDASMVNGVLGFVSFDQIQEPRMTVVFRAPTLGVAHATLGAASLADIGVNADASGLLTLQLNVVGFTKTEIDCANFLLTRPFN